MSTTLIFPSSMQASQIYNLEAKARGEKTIGSSSLELDDTAQHYQAWLKLPYINDTDFVEELKRVIKNYAIEKIYTPHVIVYRFISDLVAKHQISVCMANQSPMDQQNYFYQQLLAKADNIKNTFENEHVQSTLSRYFIAAILRESALIYGESSEEKIVAMLRIFASAVKGDVVEIGCAWGRSVYVLVCLNHYYQVGSVLAIDPWKAEAALQAESTDLHKEITYSWDWELMCESFKVNLASIGQSKFNYLRLPSLAAHEHYINAINVCSEEYGEVKYERKISVLHIDGNHDYEAVKRDFCTWYKNLLPNSWVILDDYLWHHGSGPFQLGNEILEQYSDKIKQHFIAGNALFLHFEKI